MSEVTYYPERDQWTLSDDQHWMEVPEWARGIIRAQHERETRPLRNENAKLRELVLHMYTCMGNVDADGNHECFSCEYEGSECDYGCRVRELGIEVDG